MYAISWLWNVLSCIALFTLFHLRLSFATRKQFNFLSVEFFRVQRHKAPEQNWSKIIKFFFPSLCLCVFLVFWSFFDCIKLKKIGSPCQIAKISLRFELNLCLKACHLHHGLKLSWVSLKLSIDDCRCCFDHLTCDVNHIDIYSVSLMKSQLFISLRILIKLWRSRSNLRHKIYDQFNRERLNVITLTASSLQPRLKFFMFFSLSRILAPIIC